MRRFSPSVNQSSDIMRPMNPVLPADWLTPTRDMSAGYGPGRASGPVGRFQPSRGVLSGGVQDALAVLSFTDSILRG